MRLPQKGDQPNRRVELADAVFADSSAVTRAVELLSSVRGRKPDHEAIGSLPSDRCGDRTRRLDNSRRADGIAS